MHLAVAAGIPVIEVSCDPRTGSDAPPHSPVRFGPRDVENLVAQPAVAHSPCTLPVSLTPLTAVWVLPSVTLSRQQRRSCA